MAEMRADFTSSPGTNGRNPIEKADANDPLDRVSQAVPKIRTTMLLSTAAVNVPRTDRPHPLSDNFPHSQAAIGIATRYPAVGPASADKPPVPFEKTGSPAAPPDR